MAEGGETTTSFENPAYDPYDDPYDDDRFNETNPFIPQSSTPYGGEQIVMQTMQHEESGLPETSFAETSFLTPKTDEAAWIATKDLFPNISSSKLEVKYDPKDKLQVKMFGAGKKQYSLLTTDRRTKLESINKNLPKEIRAALGQSKDEMIEEKRKKEQKELRQKELASQTEEKKKTFDAIMNEKENLEEELKREKSSDHPDERKIKKLQGRVNTLNTERIKAKKALDESYLAEKDADNLAEELAEEEEEVSHTNEELRTLRKHKENLIWRRNQELDYFLHEPNFAVKLDPNLSPEELEQQKKNSAKKERGIKKKIKELNDGIREDDDQERALERFLGQKRTISDLKAEQLRATRKELTEKIEEAKKIADNEDADPEKRKIARQKIAVIDFEIRQIDTELQENSFGSLREKVKEIFKKYGLTLAGIFAAAGATIGAIIGVVTKALKDLGKKIANGLKTLGQKAASALPGLIGSIVSFLFKTAGQVFGFLAEHTWLLILAVVAFLVEKLMKKRR